MFRAAYVYQLREALRFRRLWPWLFLGVLAALLALAWGSMDHASRSTRFYALFYIMVLRLILALAAAVFASAVISAEVEQKTIVYLVTRPIPRWGLIAMRYLASATAVVVVGLFALFCVAVAIYGSPFAAPGLFADVSALVLGAAAYSALFLFVTLLSNRAMLICLLFAFGWETMATQMPGSLYLATISRHMLAIANPPQQALNVLGAFSGSTANQPLTGGVGAVALVLASVVLAALSAFWFSVFEYVPREQAG